MTHGYHDEAEATVDDIEQRVQSEGGELTEIDDSKAINIVAQKWIPYPQLARIFLKKYPKRTALGEGWERPPADDPWASFAPGAAARVHPQ